MGLVSTGSRAASHLIRRVLHHGERKLRPCDPRLFALNQHVVSTTAYVAGRRLEVFVRAATTDIALVDMILQDDSEYRLPQCVAPKIIFDIGANIGIAGAYYAAAYPDAQIYCFEPLPENIELLRKNVQPFGPRVKVLEYGLSDTMGSLTYHMSDNPHSFGGGSFCELGHDPERQRTLPVQTVAQTLDELAIDHVDAFKVDTEGSELAVVRGTPPAIRRNAQAWVGELHGLGDWEVCQLLGDTHAVGINKRYDVRCFLFQAIRRDLIEAAATPPLQQAA